jgi:uncharacterized membrane protein
VWLAWLIPVHVACGVVAVLCGAGAMVARKGSRRHRRFGRVHLVALVGLGATAPVLAAADWAHRWHLVVLGCAALGSAIAGFVAVRSGRPGRVRVHIVGMGAGYVAMLTAFYVDNGPRLPLWDRLPVVVLWLLPGLVGGPLIGVACRMTTFSSQRVVAPAAHPHRERHLITRLDAGRITDEGRREKPRRPEVR